MTAPKAEPKSITTFFLDLMVIFLIPMFLPAAQGDIAFARAAAIETIASYRAQNQLDLLAVAQIIAFGLASLGSLSLSMTDGLSIPMILKLRGNAVSTHRAGEQTRRALTRPAEPSDPINQDDLRDEAETVASVAELQTQIAEAQPATPPVPTPAQTAKPSPNPWLRPMAEVAAELTASLPHLPPAERRIAAMKAAALNNVARDLLAGKSPNFPPGFEALTNR